MNESLNPLCAFAQATVARAFQPWSELRGSLGEEALNSLGYFFEGHPDAASTLEKGATGPQIMVIEESARSLTDSERNAVGASVLFRNPCATALSEDDVPAEMLARRIDTVLEALQADFSSVVAQAVVAGYEEQLLELATGSARKILTHPLTAQGVNIVNLGTLSLFGFAVPFADTAVQYGQSMISWSPSELSAAIAVELWFADTLADEDDFDSMRTLSRDLFDAVCEASRSHALQANWTTMPQHLAILTAALRYVAGRLGDDEDFLPDVVPDLEGLRWDDAQHVAELLAIELKVDEEEGDFFNKLLDKDNFIVVNERPRPGANLGKRRRVTVDIHQFRAAQHDADASRLDERPGMVFRVNADGVAEADDPEPGG